MKNVFVTNFGGFFIVLGWFFALVLKVFGFFSIVFLCVSFVVFLVLLKFFRCFFYCLNWCGSFCCFFVAYSVFFSLFIFVVFFDVFLMFFRWNGKLGQTFAWLCPQAVARKECNRNILNYETLKESRNIYFPCYLVKQHFKAISARNIGRDLKQKSKKHFPFVNTKIL